MSSIPVLLYHHINYDNDVLSVSPELFEAHLKFLKEDGYESITKEELREYIETNKKNFKKGIIITFDDGYLDTWVYAYPLLKKYGFKAMLFLVSWTVEEDEALGYNLEDYLKGQIKKEMVPDCSSSFVNIDGYSTKRDKRLCWSEVQEMEESGVIDVQPHSKFHRKIYTSNKMIGFNHPRKHTSSWYIVKGDTRYGTVDFEKKPELIGREFKAHKALNDMLHEYVFNHGYLNFFKEAHWENQLNNIINDYKHKQQSDDIGIFESDTEMKERIKREIEIIKGEISYVVRKRLDSFSWPWGAYNNLSLNIAKNIGFRYFFTTKPGSNAYGDSIDEIKRFIIWKKDLGWFKTRVRLYSHKILANAYARIYRKI